MRQPTSSDSEPDVVADVIDQFTSISLESPTARRFRLESASDVGSLQILGRELEDYVRIELCNPLSRLVFQSSLS